ncbi:unnamed protein product [Linum tenue]|uniref:Core domain-containing protein n=2 Tax=Linum tenue TaxID=586396 RepID=A0AAV0Q4Q5_9ROSI|nr:unnamed protein product [Linum tenue]
MEIWSFFCFPLLLRLVYLWFMFQRRKLLKMKGYMLLCFLLIIRTDEKGKFDELIDEKGVKVLIDPKALMHVIGTKMDFVDDKLRSEFIFINPNSQGQCGCGESFMTTSTGSAAQGTSSR